MGWGWGLLGGGPRAGARGPDGTWACSWSGARGRKQVLLGVARGVLQHLRKQLGQRGADVGPGPHAGGEQVVAGDGEVFQPERIARIVDRGNDGGKGGAGGGRARRRP